MPDQIQIRWSNYSGVDFDESLKALRKYDPEPSVKTALAIKGNLPRKAVDDIRKIVNKYDGATLDAIMTATWGKNENPDQLRLFGPPQLELPEVPPIGEGDADFDDPNASSPNGVTTDEYQPEPASVN